MVDFPPYVFLVTGSMGVQVLTINNIYPPTSIPRYTWGGQTPEVGGVTGRSYRTGMPSTASKPIQSTSTWAF